MKRSLLGLEGGDADEAPVTRSLLGLEEAARRPAVPQAPDTATARSGAARAENPGRLGLEGGDADEAPVTRSLLGLEEAARRPPVRLQAPATATARPEAALPEVPARPGLPVPGLPADPPPESRVPVPELEREILGVEKERARAFPVERAILVSLALHIVLFFALLHAPSGAVGDHNLFRGMTAREKTDEEKIPIVFRAAPGPERENRKPSDFSDKNRRAGGGDRSKGKSETPFAPVLPGKEGLASGSAPRVAAASRAGARAGQDRSGTSGAPAEKSATSFTPPDALRNPSGAAGGSGGAAATGESSRLPNLEAVIKQEAARLAAARGEGGAGFPNDGGFVDSGPLSFETSWYDWGAYADEMVRRIKLHWDIPKLAELGWKGRLTIHFDIRVDGSVSGATLISGSGIPPFDYAAMQAILRSNPFRPLPKDLLKEVPGKQKEGVTVTFFYNMRPGKDEKFGNGS